MYFFSLSHRCTRKEKCERSSEPRRFTSDIKQCVRLIVHPSNISVSQYSVTVSPRPLTPSHHTLTHTHRVIPNVVIQILSTALSLKPWEKHRLLFPSLCMLLHKLNLLLINIQCPVKERERQRGRQKQTGNSPGQTSCFFI